MNMSDLKYPRGSEWRKWDLHVHTPYTKLNNQYHLEDGRDVWNLFCEKIEKSDIEIFGITDYFSVDNYFVFIEKFKAKYPDSKKVFFPNVEFRIDSKNSKDEHIQVHVIFSNDQSTLDKLDNFFTRLKLVSTDDENLKNKYCTATDLDEVGYDKAMVKIDELEEQLKDDFTDDEYLIVGVANGYGSLRPEKNDGRGSEYAKELDKKCKLFFGNSKNTNFFLNKIKGREQYNLPPKAVLFGSDAHSFNDLDKKLGKTFEKRNDKSEVIDYSEITWIKADPTFGGLRQIIYEPEERIRIQKNNPNHDFPKHFFSKIHIKKSRIFDKGKVEFKDIELPLNNNLVAIIGGRGTGKSLLLDAIAKTFNQASNRRADNITINNENFIVEFTKPDGSNVNYKIQENNNLEYLHIHQGQVKEIVDPENPKKLSDEIKHLLNINPEPTYAFGRSQTSRLIDEIFEIKEFLDEVDEDGNKIHSREFIETLISNKKQLIANITTRENKQLIEDYIKNLNNINNLTQKIKKLSNLKDELEIFKEQKNNIIKQLNKSLVEKNLKIPEISFFEQLDKVENALRTFETQKKELIKRNQKIQQQFTKAGIKGDISTLLEKTEQYQREINKLQSDLEITANKENALKENVNKLADIVESIEKSHNAYIDRIENKWEKLKNGKPNWTDEQKELVSKYLLKDIDLDLEDNFDIEEFYKLIKESLNLTKFRETTNESRLDKIKQHFKIHNKEDFIKIFTNSSKMRKLLYEDIYNKEGAKKFFKILFTKFNSFWNVVIKPKYQNKNVDQLSVGMKGTMYLSLKLATNPFVDPFIFDQPEDDLDNNFIMKKLVPIFKKIKKFRQVIIVTHNANLVVNADAEQVIIAKNNAEVLSYESGSIENPYIKEQICNILEGGEKAFEMRRNKYNLND